MEHGGSGEPCFECRDAYEGTGSPSAGCLSPSRSVPCEESGDDACPVSYPPAEPDPETAPALWEVWDLYWQIDALGWDAVRHLGGLARFCAPRVGPDPFPDDDDERTWLLDALQSIEYAVRTRRSAELEKPRQ